MEEIAKVENSLYTCQSLRILGCHLLSDKILQDQGPVKATRVTPMAGVTGLPVVSRYFD